MVGTGSSHSRFINGDDGTIGVGHEVGVEVEGTTVAVGNRGSMSVNSTNSDGTSNDRSSSNGGHNGSSGSESSSLGSEVVGTGSSHSRFVNGDDGAVGVGDKVGVQVEGTSVAVSRGVGGGSSVANGSNRGGVGNRDSSNGGSSHKRPSSELGGEMVGLQGGHTGLVDGGDGTVGVALQTEEALGGGEGETGGENLKGNFDSLFTLSVTLTHQKLHGVFGCVLELKLRRVELK